MTRFALFSRPMRRLPLLLALTLTAACGRTAVVRYVDPTPDAAVDAGQDAGVDAGLSDAGAPDAGPPDAGCMPATVALEPAVPTVLFVIDRSGSMLFDIDGREDAGLSASRWTVLEASLGHVLPQHDQDIAMGALMYPVNGDSCDSPVNVDLVPARGNASRVVDLFATRPVGGTPTFSALDVAARSLLAMHTAGSARSLVLATDGTPNCNASLDGLRCTCTRPQQQVCIQDPQNCLDDQRTVTSLEHLFQDSKLPTYVIGLGSDLDPFSGTLDAMAVAGGVPRVGPGKRYYSATSEPELTDALSRITAQLTRCTYLIVGSVPPGVVHFRIDGDDVPSGPEGWEWLDQANGELTVHGVACDRVTMGGRASLLVDCE